MKGTVLLGVASAMVLGAGAAYAARVQLPECRVISNGAAPSPQALDRRFAAALPDPKAVDPRFFAVLPDPRAIDPGFILGDGPRCESKS